MSLDPGDDASWVEATYDLAEGGDLQAIGYLAAFDPNPDAREIWLSIYMGELEAWDKAYEDARAGRG